MTAVPDDATFDQSEPRSRDTPSLDVFTAILIINVCYTADKHLPKTLMLLT